MNRIIIEKVYEFFESESLRIFCIKEQIVLGEKEVNHDQSNRPQKQQEILTCAASAESTESILTLHITE